MNYTEEQIKDIQDREKKCLDFLKEQQMSPSCQIQYVNTGGDTFGTKLIPYLQDFKYTDKLSPLQRHDLTDTKN